MPSLRPPSQVLYVDDVAIERDAAGGWVFTWNVTDVNERWVERCNRTAEELAASGPPGRMTADALDGLARALGREPSSLPWCVERRLVECIVADDVEGTLAQLAAMGADERPAGAVGPTLARADGVPEPILEIALGVAAMAVAAELVGRGEPLTAPRDTTWDAADFAIAALDGSEASTVVLQRLIARGAVVPSGPLLRHAQSPRIVHALIDAGAHPDAWAPACPSRAHDLGDATPLAVAVLHRDEHGADRLDVAAALLERGASIEARDRQGRTALILAAMWGNDEPVRWLLDHGADLECAADAHGRTPRSLAHARPDDPASRLLLAALAKGGAAR